MSRECYHKPEFCDVFRPDDLLKIDCTLDVPQSGRENLIFNPRIILKFCIRNQCEPASQIKSRGLGSKSRGNFEFRK